MGLMQVMPKTWAELRARYSLGDDPYDPNDNILAGTAYIRELDDRYGAPGFLAAYNAGPSRYEKHLATGRPLPDETRAYVATLKPMIERKQASGETVVGASRFTWAGSPLFAARAENNSTGARPPSDAHPNRRSNVRAVVDLSALIPQSGDLFVRRAYEVRSQ